MRSPRVEKALSEVEEQLAQAETDTGCPVDTGLEDGCTSCHWLTKLGRAIRALRKEIPPAVDAPRTFDFDELRSIAICAAKRARDLPAGTPEQCTDAVLADLGHERPAGPPVLVHFEAQIVFCRVCGRHPLQHPFGPCGD